MEKLVKLVRLSGISTGVAALAALLALVGGAQADDGAEFYAGASVGIGKSAELCNARGIEVLGCSDRATAGKAIVGVRFNRFLGAEIGFARTSPVRRSDAVASYKFTLRHSISYSGIFYAPVFSDLTPFARLGFHQYNMSYRTTVDQPPSAVQSSENGQAFLFAVGLQHRFNDLLSLRLAYEQLKLNYKKLPNDRLHTLSAAVLFHF